MTRLLLAVLVVALATTACGGGSEDATATTDQGSVSTAVAEALAATAAAQPTVTATSTMASSATATTEPTAAATSTAEPMATRRPTRTPAPTATPAPLDLGQYLPIPQDLNINNDYTMVDDQPQDAAQFAYQTGFVQGRMRSFARSGPELVSVTLCAEYTTSDQAAEALEGQYTAIMANTAVFRLTDDPDPQMDATNSRLAGGVYLTEGEERPTAVGWFQVGRVMCFTIASREADGGAPPRALPIEAANGPLERLAQAAAPTPTAIPDGTDVFDIGEVIRFEDGFTVTVKTLEDPVVRNGEAVSPEASIVLTAIEIEACAGSQTTDGRIAPRYFSISLSDNSRAERSYSLFVEPELDDADLFPGECLSGWVTFERHWEPRPVYVVIDIIGYSTVRVKAR